MKLLSITSNYFRGFGSNYLIQFDSPLTIIYGPNGTGKTAIAEALEWLLFANTYRRKYTDIDEVEHRGALKSVLCPESELPFVQAEFQLTDDSKKTLKRELLITGTTEQTIAYIDGVQVPNFNMINLSRAENFYPIIIQENLQGLIKTTGAARRNYISRILGLETLLDFDRAIDSACDRFMNSLPPNIQSALTKFQQLTNTLRQQNILHGICQRWSSEEIQYSSDWDEILAYCRQAIQRPEIPPDEIATEATRLAESARRNIFDIAPFGLKQDASIILENCDKILQGFRETIDTFKLQISTYAQVRAEMYAEISFELDDNRLHLWEQGLKLIDVSRITPEKPALNCPFCDELTITKNKAAEITRHLDQTRQFSVAKTQLIGTSQQCCDVLNRLSSFVKSLLPNQTNQSTQDTLHRLLPDNPVAIQSFTAALNQLHTDFTALKANIACVKDNIENILSIVDTPSRKNELELLFSETIPSLNGIYQLSKQRIEQYPTTYERFSAILRPILSSDENVRHWETISELSSSATIILTVENIFNMINKLRQIRQSVRVFWTSEDQRRMDERGEDIVKWFNLLYGGASDIVKFAGIEPRGTTMRLKGEILGEMRHASSHFSQSQLNCLGLAIHIATATAESCPFNFIMFDDPIQSFDDEHREQLISHVVKELIEEHSKQVIIMTHLYNFADRLKYAYAHLNPLYHELKPFSDSGISHKPRNYLRALSHRIIEFSKEDNTGRDVACHLIRKWCEHLTKAIFQISTGRAISPQYESATGSYLISLLCTIPGFSEADFTYINDSINFGVQPSHDDPEWTSPDKDSIIHRIDRLKQIARNHNVDL